MRADDPKERMEITRMSRSSWFKIKLFDSVLHFDPGYAGFFQNQGIPTGALKEKADLIFISHSHKDHLQSEALNLLHKEEIKVFAPKSCAEIVGEKQITVCPGSSLFAGNLMVKCVDAYNTPEGHSTRKVHHKGDFVGYLIQTDTWSLYFAGDTDLIPEMSSFGKIDIAFLPIGGTYVMDVGEAAQAVAVLHPTIVIPMHEANTDPETFCELVRKNAGVQVKILKVGETITI